MSQRIDDFARSAGFDLQPYHVALAAAVQFTVHKIKQVAGFFLVQVKIAVAGGAKCG